MSKESDNNKQVLVNQLAQAELDLASAEEYLDRARTRKLKILGAIEYHEQLFAEKENSDAGTVAAVESAAGKAEQKVEKKKGSGDEG